MTTIEKSSRALPTNGHLPGITLSDDGKYSLVLPRVPAEINHIESKLVIMHFYTSYAHMEVGDWEFRTFRAMEKKLRPARN